MFTLTGKYADAKVYATYVESAAISQVLNMLNQPFLEGERVRMMPDIHPGSGCTIGTTMTISNKKICPNLIGVDIGCGMYVVKLKERECDYAKLDAVIREYIPAGVNVTSQKEHPMAEQFDINSLRCSKSFDADIKNHIMCALGSLGSGNHFIELNRSKNDGALYLVIHSGSRQLGIQVAKYYQKAAIRDLHNKIYKTESQKVIRALTEQNRKHDIQNALANLVVTYPPDELSWCEDSLADDYLHDMVITQNYATLNREIMAHEIVTHMGWQVKSSFTTIHNYIDRDTMILRKGSVSAQKGEKLLIPINMRDGSLLCEGLGNPEWNYSAPHGAGRLMSRANAKEVFTVNEFAAQMQNVYTTSVSQATLDECPMAYKPMDAIVDAIEGVGAAEGGTARIIDLLIPVYNFKA